MSEVDIQINRLGTFIEDLKSQLATVTAERDTARQERDEVGLMLGACAAALAAARRDEAALLVKGGPPWNSCINTFREEIDRVTERLCRFNCDAESPCRCAAHEVRRAALRGSETP